MVQGLNITVLDRRGEGWTAWVDRLRECLGAATNPTLFPPQFLKVTLPKIGGRIVVFEVGSALLGAGFLFPRALSAGRPVFTLRFHRAQPDFEPDWKAVIDRLERRLGGEIVLYDPSVEQVYVRTGQRFGEISVGRPGAEEAAAIPWLQQQVWGSEAEFLYPADIHAPAFRLGTSLVARHGSQIAGCLFGFYKFDGSPLPASWAERYPGELRVESQLMGVLPAFRGHGIGFLLKKLQAEEARNQGIAIVNWTVDPLQYGNAVLNFGKLRAVAFAFHRDYYPYRNVLNRVPASRLEISWLVKEEHVEEALAGEAEKAIVDLSRDRPVRRVNEGWSRYDLNVDDPVIAIEIPAHWTALQQDSLEEALRWREVSDTLLQHYLGIEQDKYVVNGVGEDGDRRFLIAERVGCIS